jgi:hypothetical protein
MRRSSPQIKTPANPVRINGDRGLEPATAPPILAPEEEVGAHPNYHPIEGARHTHLRTDLRPVDRLVLVAATS